MVKIASNGIELEVERFGQGEPIVLIMGLGSQMIQWHEDFCAELADEGFEVVRFDNRDIGLSTHLDHLGTPNVRRVVARGYLGLPVRAAYTLTDMALDVAGLIDALGFERAHVVGVSMGGMIAQRLTLDRPDKVRSLTSIMSTTGSRRHGLARPEALKALLAPLPPTLEGRIENAVHIFRVLSGPGFPFDEDAIRDLAARSYARSFHPAGFIRHLCAISAASSREKELRAVRTPTTVIHGTHDPLVPASAGIATARAVPNARLQWIEGMGHSLPRGAWPEIIRSIVDNARRRA